MTIISQTWWWEKKRVHDNYRKLLCNEFQSLHAVVQCYDRWNKFKYICSSRYVSLVDYHSEGNRPIEEAADSRTDTHAPMYLVYLNQKTLSDAHIMWLNTETKNSVYAGHCGFVVRIVQFISARQAEKVFSVHFVLDDLAHTGCPFRQCYRGTDRQTITLARATASLGLFGLPPSRSNDPIPSLWQTWKIPVSPVLLFYLKCRKKAYLRNLILIVTSHLIS